MDRELKRILVEEMGEEILERMPEWFKRLRKSYLEKSALFF